MTIQEANQQLMGDFKRVMHDAEELLKATSDEASEKVKQVRTRLATALESARITCEHLQIKTTEAAKAANHIIREHPYEFLGAAFGTGLLIGILVARR